MNRKWEAMGMIGVLLVVFVSVIIGLALFNGGITSNVGASTQTVTYTNQTITFQAAGSTVTLNGKLSSNVVVINQTSGTVVPSSNYTILNNVIVNGALASQLQAANGYFNGVGVNISYVSQPLGYIPDSGSRSIAGIIIIMAALAIAAIVLAKAWEGVKDAGFI